MTHETIAQVVERFGLEHIDTGGGFTALYLKLHADGAHLLITELNDLAPNDENTDPNDLLAIGIYDEDRGEAKAIATQIPAHLLADVLGLIMATRAVLPIVE